jgi:hypothetical protein
MFLVPSSLKFLLSHNFSLRKQFDLCNFLGFHSCVIEIPIFCDMISLSLVVCLFWVHSTIQNEGNAMSGTYQATTRRHSVENLCP